MVCLSLLRRRRCRLVAASSEISHVVSATTILLMIVAASSFSVAAFGSSSKGRSLTRSYYKMTMADSGTMLCSLSKMNGRKGLKRHRMFDSSREMYDGGDLEKSRKKSRWEIPNSAIDKLKQGAVTFPCRFTARQRSMVGDTSRKSQYYFPGLDNRGEDTSTKVGEMGAEVKGVTTAVPAKQAGCKNSAVLLTVRHLEASDLDKVVTMCVDEFGSYSPTLQDQPLPGFAVTPTSVDDLSIEKILEPLWARYENWSFSWVVRIGLLMRIQRRIEGFQKERAGRSEDDFVHDHNVLCLLESDTESFGEEGRDNVMVVAIAEISLQPPDPERTAPPYVLPINFKRATSRLKGLEPSNLLGAYVSNVLVHPSRRGRGYGRALMAACEGLGRKWGCEDVSLHVDADSVSGRAAQGLYQSLGYQGVADTGRGSESSMYNWIGPNMLQKGLYIVDGVPLLYLRKTLENR